VPHSASTAGEANQSEYKPNLNMQLHECAGSFHPSSGVITLNPSIWTAVIGRLLHQGMGFPPTLLYKSHYNAYYVHSEE
jgi:hypothetical protein